MIGTPKSFSSVSQSSSSSSSSSGGSSGGGGTVIWQVADILVDDGPSYGSMSGVVDNLGTASLTVISIACDAPGFTLDVGGASLPYVLLPGMSFGFTGASAVTPLSGFTLTVTTSGGVHAQTL